MPSLSWNKKWGQELAEFVPSSEEQHWGDRWGDPERDGARARAAYIEVHRRYLEPYLRPALDVVEIGSGGGRWTKYLLPSARRLVVVELNPESFDYLLRRFPSYAGRMEFYRTSGYEMTGVRDATIDLVFSFDVFVCVEPEGIAAYLDEIERVLRPGGRAVVLYADQTKPLAAEKAGYSDMDSERMDALLRATDLIVLEHDCDGMCDSNLIVVQK